MIVAWIVAVWLLSLAVFVALRAYSTKSGSTPGGRRRTSKPVAMPAQRESWDPRSRLSDRR